mgnify:FL=1
MRGPDANLPSLTQPWGRWVDSSIAESELAVERFAQSGASISDVGLSMASNIGSRIRTIDSRRVDVFQVADFTRSFPSVPFGTVLMRVADSPIIYFNSPKAGVATIIVNCESDEGNTATLLIRVNGEDIGNGNTFRYSGTMKTAYGNSIASAAVDAELLDGPNSIQVGVRGGIANTVPTSFSILNMTIAISYQEN